MQRDTRQPKIENIYILSRTQVSNPELRRGCMLDPLQVFAIGKRYDSVEKLPTGQTVRFRISEEAAAELILANKAVNVIKEAGKWVAADIFGDKLRDGMPIVIEGKKKEVA
jgi:hypothetical protein